MIGNKPIWFPAMNRINRFIGRDFQGPSAMVHPCLVTRESSVFSISSYIANIRQTIHITDNSCDKSRRITSKQLTSGVEQVSRHPTGGVTELLQQTDNRVEWGMIEHLGTAYILILL
jgi:hypothetical protein